MEIQKRCDFLVRVIERENDELQKKEQLALAPVAEDATTDEKVTSGVISAMATIPSTPTVAVPKD
jgi:hypothetical protein